MALTRFSLFISESIPLYKYTVLNDMVFLESVLLVPCLYGYAIFSVLKHKKYSCFYI